MLLAGYLIINEIKRVGSADREAEGYQDRTNIEPIPRGVNERKRKECNKLRKEKRSIRHKGSFILIKLDEWRNKKLYKTDATIQLFTSPENITRVHSSQLSVSDFV